MLKFHVDELTRRGIEAIRAGNTTAGRGLLKQAVEAEPGNALAWHWLASVGVDEAEQRRCLLRVLEINPDHPFALRDLAALDQRRARQAGKPTTTTFTRPSSPSAVKLDNAQGVANEVARYKRKPASIIGAAPAQAIDIVDAGAPVSARDGAQNDDKSLNTDGTGAATPGAPTPATPETRADAVAAAVSPSPSVTEILASIRSGRPPGASGRVTRTAVEGGETAAGAHEEVPLGPPLTADDAVALVDKEQHVQATAPAAPIAGTRKRNLAILGLLCLALALGMGTRHIVHSRTNAAGSGPVVVTGALAPKGAATTIRTAYGAFSVPGTAYLNNRVGPAVGEGSVIPIQRTPFGSSRRATCTLPNGAAVLLLDMRTAEDGSRAFAVQHRECAGWVAESFLNPTPLGLPPAPTHDTVGWN